MKENHTSFWKRLIAVMMIILMFLSSSGFAALAEALMEEEEQESGYQPAEGLPHEHAYTVSIKEPTCTEHGYTE